ncbi:MAG: hypothetical protein JO222_08695 [Frankiales bacterium]|nr:hypothetical protein [Frankiales bacterium]
MNYPCRAPSDVTAQPVVDTGGGVWLDCSSQENTQMFGEILRSKDGGNAWTLQSRAVGGGGHLIVATSRVAWWSGKYGVFRTTSGGRRWVFERAATNQLPTIPQAVAAFGPVTAAVTDFTQNGGRPVLHLTRDGGRHWVTQPIRY